MIKLATIENNPEFNGLVNACGGQPLLKSIFGQYNFSSLVEFSYLTLIASNDKECLGFVAFNDGGLVSGEMESFDEILEELRPIIPVKVSNTLFLNFWAIDINIDFDIELGDAIMRKAFHYCPDVDYFLWLGHKSVRLSDYMKERFVELDCSSREGAGGNGDPLKNFRVFAMHRSKYLPKLQVREARVEDNDDLLPILKASNPHLLANQDDFFLADLIQTQDHRNRFFVGVDNNIPVGMLSTSLDVNIHLITRIFDMDCYVDLLRTPMVEIKYKQMFFLGICANQAQCDILNMHSHEEGCVVYDASTSAVLTAYDAQEGDSDVTIDDVVDDINRHISALKLTALSAGPRADKVPQAVVLLNFPRNSNEARLYLASPATPTVTAVVELSSADKEEEFKETKGESKLEEDGKVNEDEWEVMLSTLRSNLLGADGLGNKSTEWIKLATSEDDVQSLGFQYLTVLKSLLDSHKEPEEPLADTPKTSSLVANGFALTVFCTTSELESRASDLLKVAFEEYPHLDYCLLMLPNDAPPTSLTRLMTQVKLRVGISFDQSLYVLHRQTLLAHEYLHVTRLIASLEKSVIRFVEPLGADGDSLMEAAYAALVENDVDLKDNPSEACFVAMLGGDVVGMMTISRKSASTEDINWFRANYQIEDQVSYDRHRGRAQAVITDWTMTPTFSRWGRYMLREVMRHYGKTLIYYQCPENCCPPIEVLNEMIPVLPRTRMQAALPQLPRGRVKEVPPPEPLPLVARPSENAPSNSCPLFYIAKNQLVTPKQIVSTRIVVVGGCLSTFPLLETLMFVPYIQLTNVYLVMESPPTAVTENNKGSKANSEPPAREYSPPPSPDKSGAGTPKPVKLTEVCKHALYSSEADYAGCLSVVDTCEPLDQMVRAMGFNHTVTVIRGRLTDIDRAHKAIIVSDETVVEYDILVVAPGTHDLSYKQFQIYSTLHPVRAADKGMFGIGSCFEDRRAVNWIRKMQYKNTFAGVVVYGGGLEAWHAVGRLLQMECIEKSRINWIIPDTDLPDLGDDLVSKISSTMCAVHE